MSRLVAALLLGCLGVAAGARECAADDLARRVEDALTVRSPEGTVRARLSGLADLEGWWTDRPPPGLVFGDGGGFVNPRLSLFLDVWLGERFYGMAQFRADRGFDPLETSDGQVRADEYLLRWTPLGDQRLHLQVGKFATVAGNWVPRHLSWENPLVTAPIPYDNVTTITDTTVPASDGEFLARRDVPDKKRAWIPVVWGPSYATGGALFGSVERWDWALEVKNAALGARPTEWDVADRGFRYPAVTGRIGWRPNAPWTLGMSGSTGVYLREEAIDRLPRSVSPGDARETVIAADARWARHRLEVWSELFAARFGVPIVPSAAGAVPRAEHADTLAWYLEARWRVLPAAWVALRWNQQFFGDVPDGQGGQRAWDRDAWRIDLGVGWRPLRWAQAKLQYAYRHNRGPLQQGEQMVVTQVTVKF
jgi:hypothetical protein